MCLRCGRLLCFERLCAAAVMSAGRHASLLRPGAAAARRLAPGCSWHEHIPCSHSSQLVCRRCRDRRERVQSPGRCRSRVFRDASVWRRSPGRRSRRDSAERRLRAVDACSFELQGGVCKELDSFANETASGGSAHVESEPQSVRHTRLNSYLRVINGSVHYHLLSNKTYIDL